MTTMAHPVLHPLINDFLQRFGESPQVFRAPGRVNLIGEHTDYNNGFVMPAALEFSTWVAASPRTDGKFVVASREFHDQFEFSLTEPSSRQRRWTDYVQGIAVTLKAAGLKFPGANLLISSDVPIGAGLSSSAALEVATGFALLQLAGTTPDLVQLAELCQRAENEFVGTRCGIMDQFISCLAEQGHCLMIDCRSLNYSKLPIPERCSLVICNTMVRHELASGEYNLRREQCEEGLEILRRFVPQARSLRDINLQQLEQHATELPDVLYRRCRHVVTEIQRVIDAATALKQGDLQHFGELMRQSHVSLRDDYEVSCPELDLMVELASPLAGVYGCRMTGGGFGGCTINLIKREAAEEVSRSLAADYERRTGICPEIYISAAGAGVGPAL
ncbi:MAG TPA: galactokinase [Candidatus Angelobacter sp.]